MNENEPKKKTLRLEEIIKKEYPVFAAGYACAAGDEEQVKQIFHDLAAQERFVCALVLNDAIKLAKKAIVDIKTLIIFIAVFACMLIFDVSPVVFVVLCAAAGIVLTRMGVRGK